MMVNDPDWAPTLNIGHDEVAPSNPGRHTRRQRRSKISRDYGADSDTALNTKTEFSTAYRLTTWDAMCLTDLTSNKIKEMVSKHLHYEKKKFLKVCL